MRARALSERWDMYRCPRRLSVLLRTGFDGMDCEADIDECAGEPCQNGSVCVDGVNGFECLCPGGFAGATCETNIDECATGSEVGPAVLPPTGATTGHVMIHTEATLLDGCVDAVSFRIGSPPDGFGSNWEVRAYVLEATRRR